MAACKFTTTLTIKQTDLPVTCKLQKLPKDVNIKDVTIILAQMFDANGTPTTLPIAADGQSFSIPNTSAKGPWDIEVRVKGGKDPIPPIPIVEDCDKSQLILTITDPVAMLAHADVVVQ